MLRRTKGNDMRALKRLMAAAMLAAIAGLAATPANAAMTVAGTTITNNVSVAYKVNNISQTGVTATNSFTVDRKINLTVVADSTTTTVTPGQTQAVVGYLVSNLSNAPIDIGLAASVVTGSGFTPTNVKIYQDTNGNGVYDAGTDTQITSLNQIAPETSNLRVFIVADVPLGTTSGQIANMRLTGTAAEPTAVGTPVGATITATTGPKAAGVNTVLADTKTTGGNTALDGIDFDQGSYTVQTAAVTATKTSRVVSDPINGTTNPKAIPGAVIEYCVQVNNSGGAPATSVSVNDPLPTATTYDSTFGVKVNGTVTSGTCNTDGTLAGAQAGGTVTGTIPTLVANDTRTVLFHVTIN